MYATEKCANCGAPEYRLTAHSTRRRTVYDLNGPREYTYTMEHCHECGKFKICQWFRDLIVGRSKMTKALADRMIAQTEEMPLWKVARLYENKHGVSLPENTLHYILTTRRLELIDEKAVA